MALEGEVQIAGFYYKVNTALAPVFKAYTTKFLDAQLKSLGAIKDKLSYEDRNRLADLTEINSRPIFGPEKALQIKKLVLAASKDLLYVLNENQVPDAESFIKHKLMLMGVPNMLTMTEAQKTELFNQLLSYMSNKMSTTKAYMVRSDLVRALDIREKYYET